MKQQIIDFLSRIEDSYDIKILLSVEQSSRSWGYDRKDSDHDIFFIFKQSTNDYILFDKEIEVLEKKYVLSNGLEVSFTGFNLKKSLGLMAKSNTTILEAVMTSKHHQEMNYIYHPIFVHQLHEYIIEHYNYLRVCRSYMSTCDHHLTHDFERFTELNNTQKMMKHLIAGHRALGLASDIILNDYRHILSKWFTKDYLDKYLGENIIENYRKNNYDRAVMTHIFEDISKEYHENMKLLSNPELQKRQWERANIDKLNVILMEEVCV